MIHMHRTLRVIQPLARTILSGLIVAVAGVAAAQEIPETGGKVFGLVGGSFGDGDAAVVTSGGAGLRVSPHLGIDFEVFHVSGLDLSEDRFFIQRLTFAPPIRVEREAGLTAFLTKLNVDFPVGDRMIPFISGGGGIGRLSEEISFDFANTITRPLIFPPEDITRSETGLILTLGGGLDIRLWKGLTVEPTLDGFGCSPTRPISILPRSHHV